MINSIRSFISQYFDCTMDVYRHETIERADGATISVLPDTPLHTDVPCRLASVAINRPTTDWTNLPVNIDFSNVKIYFSHDVDVEKGDKITLRSHNAVWEGYATVPFRYPTHAMIMLQMR